MDSIKFPFSKIDLFNWFPYSYTFRVIIEKYNFQRILRHQYGDKNGWLFLIVFISLILLEHSKYWFWGGLWGVYPNIGVEKCYEKYEAQIGSNYDRK